MSPCGCRSRSLVVDGVDVVTEVRDKLDRMSAFAEEVRSGEWLGATGRRIRAVVNIGIGGSDLGPAMAYAALQSYATPELTVRFVSNVDPDDLAMATKDLDPAETLFVVVSKTMSTLETIEERKCGARMAGRGPRSGRRPHTSCRRGGGKTRSRRAHRGSAGERVSHVGVGWRPDVSLLGGRAFAADRARRRDFRALLGGFHAMDEHFATAALGGTSRSSAGSCPSGTGTSWARRPSRSCRTAMLSGFFLPTSSSSGWSRTGSRSRLPASRSQSTRDRSCGAVRERTRSTRSSSSSIRGPCWCPST